MRSLRHLIPIFIAAVELAIVVRSGPTSAESLAQPDFCPAAITDLDNGAICRCGRHQEESPELAKVDVEANPHAVCTAPELLRNASTDLLRLAPRPGKDGLAGKRALLATIERSRDRIRDAGGAELGETSGEPCGHTPTPATPATRSPFRWRRGFWGVGLGIAIAASILVGVYASGVLSPPAPIPSDEWGWNRPGAFARAEPRAEYLNFVADLADDWFKKKPDNPTDLARRIGQMREGCSALLLADLAPLKLADRDWLKEKCKKWAAAIDGELAKLEAGQDPRDGARGDGCDRQQARQRDSREGQTGGVKRTDWLEGAGTNQETRRPHPEQLVSRVRNSKSVKTEILTRVHSRILLGLSLMLWSLASRKGGSGFHS